MDTPFFSLEVPQKGLIDGHVHFELKKGDEETVQVTALCANLVSSLLFEKLQAQGTNLVMKLSDSGGWVDVVARNQDDGLGLEWVPAPLDPERLDDAQSKISEKTLIAGAPQPDAEPAQEPEPEPEPEKDVPVRSRDEEEEQLIKQITRIP